MQRVWSRRQARRARVAPTDDNELPSIRPPGRLARSAWLGLAALVALVVGTPVTRWLQAYRGVVLERRGEQMFLAFEDRPPRWLEAIDVPAGTLIYKEVGDWRPHPETPRGGDLKLMQMYKRFTSAYDGVITRIEAPLAPAQASTAVVVLDTGGKVRVPLWSEDLAAAAVGRRVRKLPGNWDPLLVDAGVDAGVDTGVTAPAALAKP